MPDDLGLTLLRRASLDEVMACAALLERTDRKYVVPRPVVHRLVEQLAATHHVLSVAGRTSTTYRTQYVDTADLLCVRDHIQRRRRRFKARSRLYVEDGLCRFEVKTKEPRGGTVKVQTTVGPDRFGRFGDEEAAFLEQALREAAVPGVPSLEPTVEMTYERATLVDLAGGSRVTLDAHLVATGPAGRVRLDPGFVLVETKSGASPSLADLVLRRLGQRPRSFSKYAATASLLHDHVPANDVHRLTGTALHLERISA